MLVAAAPPDVATAVSFDAAPSCVAEGTAVASACAAGANKVDKPLTIGMSDCVAASSASAAAFASRIIRSALFIQQAKCQKGTAATG